ncbi:MAG: hypothetical protein KGI69_03650 [Patescibacteria group bacterium]|nr:hypothetical protein [Patescibacteria group bacterium]
MNAAIRPQHRARQSDSFARRRRSRAAIGAAAGLAALASWAFVAVRLAGASFMTVSTINVYGADPDIVPAIQAAAAGALDGTYAGLFPRSDVWIYPHADVAEAVASSSPRIRTASVSRGQGNALDVSVTERVPAAVICPGFPNEDDSGAMQPSGTCYYADDRGYIFEEAPAQPAPGLGLYYMPALASGGTAAAGILGSFATSSAEFAALQAFVEDAQAAGISSQAVLAKDGGEYELYADGLGAEGQGATSSKSLTVIYFDDAGGLAGELADLRAFWLNAEATGRAKGQLPGFEYIDVRYGSNVFYRLAK